MNRPFKALRPVVALLAVGLIASVAAPAQAGDASWNDPSGDANEFSVIESTPLPTNDALDMSRNDVRTVGGNIVWRVKVKQMAATGYPQHSTGYSFRMYFTWEEAGSGSFPDAPKNFEFVVSDELTLGKKFEFNALGVIVFPLECVKCTGVIDRKTSSVIMTAPVAAVAAGMKKAFPDMPVVGQLPVFGPGAELTGLFTRAQRTMGPRPATADTSRAPVELAYIV